ncbi:MAG TPA: DoxX-like family protein [Actinomycetota bacterium]|nr:DoxX-like family protein [Actinomycetota bacterium]
MTRRLSLTGLVALMGISGLLHLVKPEPYERIVPRIIGHPEALVFYSGLTEIASSVLLAIPRTRRIGAGLIMIILVAVFPANIQMALDGPTPGGGFFTGSSVRLWLRLPVQPLLIWWAYTFFRA